mmetsp:Transcript_36241/g.79105  ORF Transcript_36241/g.79105 Transcript_36241/m.79105 type:complete len:369 (+) Transcript_36241:44-1150(+)
MHPRVPDARPRTADRRHALLASPSTRPTAPSERGLINGRFRLGRKIGSGSFGEVHLGTGPGGEEVAIKMEPIGAKHPQLLMEARIYKTMADGAGIPKVHWCGADRDHVVLVMELLGPSLEDLLGKCGGRFSLKTVLMLAEQMLNRIEFVHGKSFLHRDIKPDNFLVGLGRGNEVFMIDFGLGRRYKDARTGAHIGYREGKSLTGTARYASTNTHLGREQGRRDDLEGLGYVLLYLLRGHLPWQGLRAATKKEKYDKIMKKKLSTSLEVLCEGAPHQFVAYMAYCRSLKFEERPDYQYARRLFRDAFVSLDYQFDLVFDWNLTRTGRREAEEERVKSSGRPGEGALKTVLRNSLRGRVPTPSKSTGVRA